MATTNEGYVSLGQGVNVPTQEVSPPISPPVPEPQPEPVVIQQTPPPKQKGFPVLVFAILFIALFALGVWLSSFVRQYIPAGGEELGSITPTPVADANDPYADWNTYTTMDVISYKLPGNVLSPICDTTNCASYGTYLPGGTRFTVAPRGTGFALADFRGSAIADVNGVTFTTTDTVVAGKNAKEFVGTFTGRTVSGYAFVQMRGVMIEVSPTTSLEINHFVPAGVAADFAADDALFDSILKTISLPDSIVPTSAVVPTEASPSGQ